VVDAVGEFRVVVVVVLEDVDDVMDEVLEELVEDVVEDDLEDEVVVEQNDGVTTLPGLTLHPSLMRDTPAEPT